MATATDELRRIAADIRATDELLTRLHLNPIKEMEAIMAALDQLKTYPARIDAVTAAIGTDTATAVANATASRDAQIASLTASAAQTETDTQTTADAIGTSISAAETAAGIEAPVVAEPPAEG